MSNRLSTSRIALANLRYPTTPGESVALAEQAIAFAGRHGADLICFPECFVPGYRGLGKSVPASDAEFLQRAWIAIAAAAGKAAVTVVLGTERIVEGALRATVLVINRDGSRAGFQDKVQLAPEEESTYSPGIERQIFQTESLLFGVVICHEGWRYPETVRWAARRGAQIVFHPHFHEGTDTIFEKAMSCRAAENSCYFASVNCAATGASTTSTIIRPDGTVLACQPHGKEGVLVTDLDLASSTGLYARRCKY